MVKNFVETLKPSSFGKYHHDETEIKVGGDGRYFWETSSYEDFPFYSCKAAY